VPPPVLRALGAAFVAALVGVPLVGVPVAAQQPAAQPPAARGRVAGAVTDSLGGRPLAAVQVTLAGTRLGAVTDSTGRYTITNVPPGTYTVEARRLGFAPAVRRGVVVVAGGEAAAASFRLRAAVLNLEAVVVTGVTDPTAGTRVPFTVGRVSAEQIPVPPTNAVEALAGRVAGAQIVTPGQPGSGINVQLRTPASISKGNAPLIVVDGVILAEGVDASTADLNALDVESVEVVKGAAAASLYGSRASNGVLQIRTRRGRELADGRTLVTVRSELGANRIQNPIGFSRYNAFRVADGRYVDAAGAPVTRDQRVTLPANVRFQENPFPGGTFDPVRQFFSAGDFGQHSVTVAQNAGRTNFLATVSRQEAGGVIQQAGGYARNDVRINLDHRPRESLSLGLSSYYSRSARSDLDDDLFFDLVNMAPDVDIAVRDTAGNLAFEPDPISRRPNPLYTVATQDRRTKRTRFLGSANARWAPLGWLSLEGNASYDRGDRQSDYFLDRDSRTIDQTFDRVGGMEMLNAQTGAFNGSLSANALRRVGELTARTSVRALAEREAGQRFGYRAIDLLVPGVRSINNVRSRLPVSDGSTGFLEGDQRIEIRTNSYIGSLGLDYAGRYIVDGLVRRDGSSLFGPEEQQQTYYRASASWRMGEERWWPLKGLVTEFKPRFSRGTAGGRPSFPDQYETYNIDATGNLVKETLGNPFLRPELATETEAGVDLIVRDRYSLQVSRARTTVTDQLLLLPLPAPAGGFESQWQNAGTLKGNTWEGTFEARLVQRPRVTWSLGMVADRTRNRITEFNRSCFITQTVLYRCAGVTVGTMYGARFAQAAGDLPAAVPAAQRDQFQTNDDGLLVWVGPGRTWRDARWGDTATVGGVLRQWGRPIVLRDSAGNQALSPIGDGNPRFRYGVTNNVRWRALSVFALLDAQAGGQVYNRTKQRMYQYYRSADVDQAGKPQEAKKPLEYYDALYNANNVNQWFVEPGGYVKLRELSVRYQLGGRPLAVLARAGARGAAVSLLGRNLFTWDRYSGYDPEVGTINRRIDDFTYPRFRTVTGSVQVDF
jgi:TonB-linked SusC/RagA family outer membrane protein